MPEEKLIIVEADATNAEGFRVDDIKAIDYGERSSGVGTVQILKITMADGTVRSFSGADAITIYATLKAAYGVVA